MGNQYRSQTVTDLYYLQLLPGRYWRRHAYIQRKTTIPGGLRLTTHINMVLGRLAHYTFDAVLVSAFLAGVKKWIENYLWVGETMMDQSVALMGSSGYFER